MNELILFDDIINLNGGMKNMADVNFEDKEIFEKNNNGDLISVIIPVYNNERFFDRCIQSVIGQSYKNIEIIIINDCSTDGVEKIIKNYKNIDNRIKYYKNDKNMGVGYTRNIGISYAEGEYIYFLDSDDYIEENCLKLLHSAIQENDSFSCMLKGYKEVNGERKCASRTKEELELLQSPSVDIRLFNKKVIDTSKIRFSDLKIGEDLEFIFKIMIFNNSVSYVDEALYTYVIHNDSSLRKNTTNQLDTILAIESIIKYAEENKKMNNFKDKIEFVAISHILLGTVGRIMNIDDYVEEDIFKCVDFINNNFPLWKDNEYVQRILLVKSDVNNRIKYLEKYGLII